VDAVRWPTVGNADADAVVDVGDQEGSVRIDGARQQTRELKICEEDERGVRVSWRRRR
jgi:hypothetical protein